MRSTTRLLLVPALALAWTNVPTAAKADASCQPNTACVWKESNAGGCRFQLRGALGDLKDYKWDDCPGNPNDAVSSFRNTWEGWTALYVDPGRQGSVFCVGPYQEGNVPLEFNDKFSSYERTTPQSRPRGC
jgi:hypothetical protein